jgi:hypothetical protein
VILHHTDEKVFITREHKHLKEINLAGELPRLTNHYVGVFQGVQRCFSKKQSDLPDAVLLHKLLFTAVDMSPERSQVPRNFSSNLSLRRD